jgi:hypothetical protein
MASGAEKLRSADGHPTARSVIGFSNFGNVILGFAN